MSIRGHLLRALNTTIVVAVLCLPNWADGQTATSVDEYLLRTYDVSDLMLNVPDYPYRSGAAAPGMGGGGGFGGGGGGGLSGGGGGGFFSVADGEARSSGTPPIDMDTLIDAIVNTVAPNSWAENGGGDADLRPVGDALVISQTRAAHDQIAELLGQLRDVLGDRKTVTVDARWLLLNSNDLDQLMPTGDSNVPKISRQVLANLTRRSTNLRGFTNCFSGQLVYVISGTRRNFVSGYIPVVGSLEDRKTDVRFAGLRGGAQFKFVSENSAVDGQNESGPRVGYQPIVEKPTFGALLEIRPTVMRDGARAIVDLRSSLTVPGGRTEEFLPQDAAAAAPPVVDRFAMDTQEFATTLRVPLGEPVLVGGLTYVPAAIGSAPESASTASPDAASENPQFYLVLELR
jgi:hypothetical protein